MRTTTTTFKNEKNKAANRPIRLYLIEDYDGASNDLRFAEWDADVTFDSLVYTKFPITIDQIAENSRGSIDTVQVTVSNISRLIQSYLEDYDFRGKKVTIKTVFADQLADTTSVFEDIFYVDSYTADQNNVVFVLSSKFDLMDINLPGRLYSRNYCRWTFKGTECGYSGSESSCKKIKSDCKVNKNNYARFGGFPSIQSRGVYLG